MNKYKRAQLEIDKGKVQLDTRTILPYQTNVIDSLTYLYLFYFEANATRKPENYNLYASNFRLNFAFWQRGSG